MILLFKILCIYFMKNVIGVYSICNSRNMHYVVRAISPPGIALESPQWSTEENVLYYVDDTGQKIHRYDPYAYELTTKEFDLGFVAFVIPVKGFPGKIIAGIETGVYFIDWYAKGNDSALSLLTVVDLGMPMNSFDDAKIDANGNLWAGTFARPPQLSANQNSDRASLYMINQYNFRNPEIKLRPVTVSNGITWSLDNNKMYYNDSPTRVVAAFDFDLKSGILANRTDFFKFDDYNITGVPDGMTKDSDGNIWVATASGASITPANYTLLESPVWSELEQVLYYVDLFGQTVFRYDPSTDQITSRTFCYGVTSLVVPVRGCPGIILVSVRNTLNIFDWKESGDKALRQISVVDVGKPDNIINDGGADARGNLWFGTTGKVTSISPPRIQRDRASLYRINKYTYDNPEIKIRPVTSSNGIKWSLDNKKMYYVDSGARMVAAYDFILKTGRIENKTSAFDFEENDIPGYPDGITIDIDGHLWVATFDGAEVVKIDPKEGKLLDRFKLPVDIVTSVGWGGENLDILYVTTAQASETNSQPLSGSLLQLSNLGTKGFRTYAFDLPKANKI